MKLKVLGAMFCSAMGAICWGIVAYLIWFGVLVPIYEAYQRLAESIFDPRHNPTYGPGFNIICTLVSLFVLLVILFIGMFIVTLLYDWYNNTAESIGCPKLENKTIEGFASMLCSFSRV